MNLLGLIACLPLLHSQYYYLSVEKDGNEATGRSRMAYLILDLCTGLGAQWFRVTEKYFAAEEVHTPWPGCRYSNVAQESPQLRTITAL